MGDKANDIEEIAKQLYGVCSRLYELAPVMQDSELAGDMFYEELSFAQRLIVELTRLTIDEEDEPEHEDESAFMPGELDDVIGEEDEEKEEDAE